MLGGPRGAGTGDKALDELLAGQDAAEVFRSGTLIDDPRRPLPSARWTRRWRRISSEDGEDAGNHRKGHSRKRVLTDSGAMDLEVPRDRLAKFEPQRVEKYARRLPGFDDKVISMYARGLATPVPPGQVGDRGTCGSPTGSALYTPVNAAGWRPRRRASWPGTWAPPLQAPRPAASRR